MPPRLRNKVGFARERDTGGLQASGDTQQLAGGRHGAGGIQRGRCAKHNQLNVGGRRANGCNGSHTCGGRGDDGDG
jgi:hypothetical protein